MSTRPAEGASADIRTSSQYCHTAVSRNSISNKTGNEITLARAASQGSTKNKVGVSCNCKKDAVLQVLQKWSKGSIFCHNTDYDTTS